MHFLTVLLTVFISCTSTSQKIIGAWESSVIIDGTPLTVSAIFTESYVSFAYYDKANKSFHHTWGGKYSLKSDQLEVMIEFHSNQPEQVGQTIQQSLKIKGNKAIAENINWQRIDNGKPGKLNGAWLITGRKRDGELTRRTPGERKTMKILSGTRFQWIAYHTGTGKFSGTGGGAYTTSEGMYTENIEFFSRDGSRVGASLEFNYELKENEWHHSGFSSKGDPIYEIWTNRAEFDQQ